MLRFMVALVVFVIGSGLSFGIAEAREKAKITIKMATLQPRGSTSMKIMEQLANDIRKETNNEVALKFYWGGVQGDENDVIRKIRLKQLHGGAFTGVGLSRIVPAVRVTELPYVFKNRDEVTYVRAKIENTLDKYFEDKGFKVLGWGEVGFVYNFSKVPITSIDVLKKQKCWVWGDDPLANEMYGLLGIKPIPLSFTDVLTSLTSNLIDTAPTTPFGAVAFRWYTKFGYMTEYPVVNGTAGMIVTKDIWDKISPESQIKIMKISKRYNNKLIKTERQENDRCVVLLKKEGIKVVRAKDSQITLDYLMKVGKEARENLVGRLYSKELLDRTLSLLDEYRKTHPNSRFQRIE